MIARGFHNDVSRCRTPNVLLITTTQFLKYAKEERRNTTKVRFPRFHLIEVPDNEKVSTCRRLFKTIYFKTPQRSFDDKPQTMRFVSTLKNWKNNQPIAYLSEKDSLNLKYSK